MTGKRDDLTTVVEALLSADLAVRLEALGVPAASVFPVPARDPVPPSEMAPPPGGLPLDDAEVRAAWGKRDELVQSAAPVEWLGVVRNPSLTRVLTDALVRFQVHETVILPGDEVPLRFGPLSFQGAVAAYQAVYAVTAAWGGSGQASSGLGAPSRPIRAGAVAKARPGDLVLAHLFCRGLETWRAWMKRQHEALRQAVADIPPPVERNWWRDFFITVEEQRRRKARESWERRVRDALQRLNNLRMSEPSLPAAMSRPSYFRWDASTGGWEAYTLDPLLERRRSSSPLDNWDQADVPPVGLAEVVRDRRAEGLRRLLAREAAGRPTSPGTQRLLKEAALDPSRRDDLPAALFLALFFRHLALAAPPLEGATPNFAGRIAQDRAAFRGVFDHWRRLQAFAAEAHSPALNAEMNGLRISPLPRPESWKNAAVRTPWEKLDAAAECSAVVEEARAEPVAPAAAPPASEATEEAYP